MLMFSIILAGKIPTFCMLCELHRHICRVFEKPGESIRPHSIAHKLRSKYHVLPRYS